VTAQMEDHPESKDISHETDSSESGGHIE